MACQLLEKFNLVDGTDFTVDYTSKRISLFNYLDSRGDFNEIFVKSGIKVNEMSIFEESLEKYFTKLIENKEIFGEAYA